MEVTDDVIARALDVLERAQAGRADSTDLAEVAIALQVFREQLLQLFTFPTFPDRGPDIYRLGSWDSLPEKQRAAYEQVRAMLRLIE